jgi:histidinol-phosphate/aromatic aminotransferase/cobyric acid decarboxylase-like protein
MGFLDYYRQFQELPHEEVSRQLRTRRDTRRALAEQPPLDLSGAAWHEPPHPEIVNAATFALRRAVNAYPDPTAAPLRAALARAHGVAPERVVVGHGAGELLRSALRGFARGGEVVVAWPGWGPLPRLVEEAGATPVPADPRDFGPRTRAVVLSRPADPTGAALPLAEVRALADALPAPAWLILDEALAGFLPDGEDALVEHPRVLHVRSFSKAHAMAGFRVGYAIVPDATHAGALAPVGGIGAPAQAGALWAVENGAATVARRRAHAARERARLGAPGHGPYVWLATDGRPLAEELAARRIFVAPGSAWGDDGHVRVTLRDSAATGRLLAALDEL